MIIICLIFIKILEDKYNIPTVVLNHPNYTEEGKSIIGTKTYIHKVNMKTLAMIHCLFYGYNVFFSDVDIAFLKNPLPFFNSTFDFNIQMETYYPYYEVNSGFMYFSPLFIFT